MRGLTRGWLPKYHSPHRGYPNPATRWQSCGGGKNKTSGQNDFSVGWLGSALERSRSSVIQERNFKEPLLRHIKRSQLRWFGNLMPPGCLPLEVIWACPTGKMSQGILRIFWRDCASSVTWKHLGVPPGGAEREKFEFLSWTYCLLDLTWNKWYTMETMLYMFFFIWPKLEWKKLEKQKRCICKIAFVFFILYIINLW